MFQITKSIFYNLFCDEKLSFLKIVFLKLINKAGKGCLLNDLIHIAYMQLFTTNNYSLTSLLHSPCSI